MTINENRNPNPRLPEELIYDILLSLPVKTLLRFRSVCKSWLSIISSRDFIKTHLAISTNNFVHHGLLLIDSPLEPPALNIRSCSIYSLLNEPSIELDCHLNKLEVLLGSCNGLFCLCGIDIDVFFWNPATRKSTTLPQLEIDFERADIQYSYGFGYDESNDDFKLVAIVGCANENKVSVYSSRSDSWGMIRDFPYEEVYHMGEYVNGAIHWIVSQTADMEEYSIASFDIKTEVFQVVSPPPKYGEVACCTLGTFGGSLSVLCYAESGKNDFWVMKECVTEQSWTKLFTIHMDGLPSYKYLIPLCVTETGDIILNSDSTIVLYNSKDDTFKDLLNCSFEGLCVRTYVESLVSPHL